MSYPSDLSDAQWEKIAPFFAQPDPRGAREKYPKRRVVEAILYRLREGCRWRALPHDFPPYDTVHDHWQRWKERGVWQEAVFVLNILSAELGHRIYFVTAMELARKLTAAYTRRTGWPTRSRR